jgi:tetratricopeptide (TPR) repeat protein
MIAAAISVREDIRIRQVLMYNHDDANNPERERQFDALVKSGQLEQALAMLQAWNEREPWNGDVLMRMAVVHWLAGEPARTLRDLDAFLTLHPDHAEALSRRAQALLMLGKRRDAEETLKRAEAIDPNTPGVALNRALLLETDGNYALAIEAITGYLKAMPTDHLALARRSHLHRQLGQYPDALEDAVACVKMKPDDPETHFAQALAHVTLEQGAEAMDACDRALKRKSSFLPALRLKIDLLADLGLMEQAGKALAQLESYEPDAPHTALLRARLATERGEFALALEWITRYLDDYPDEPYGYYRRGMIYFSMQQYDRALADFSEYARLAPRALEAYEQQYLCYLALEQYDKAVEVSKTALDMQPKNFRLQYNHAFAELLVGHVPAAKVGFHLALDLAPAHEELMLRVHQALTEHAPPVERLDWFVKATVRHGNTTTMLKGLLADIYLEDGRLEDALQLTQDVLRLDHQRPFGYMLGIKALCLLDRYPDALALADLGVELLPEDGRVRMARALVLRDMERFDAALRELELARSLLPGDAEVIIQQALTYGSLDRLADAVRLLRQALTLDAENAGAYFWLSYFLLHRRRFREALEAAERLLELSPESAGAYLLRGVALHGLRRHRQAEDDLARTRATEPGLLVRFSADPLIAELLSPSPPDGKLHRMRRTLTDGWQTLNQMMNPNG